MSKRIKRTGSNWSLNIELDDWMIFLLGIIAGTIVGKL